MMPSPPDDKRCQATTKGGMVHGAYWSPPKRCAHWARENGYCRMHQPAEHPAEDEVREGRAPDDPPPA